MDIQSASNNNSHICPITDEVAEQPVRTACNHIFDRLPLVQWLEHNPTCPLCRAPVQERDLQDLAARVEATRVEAAIPQENPVPEAIREMPNVDHLVEAHFREVDRKMVELLLKITAE